MCNFLWWWLNVACTMHSIMSPRNVQLDHFLDQHQIPPKIQRDSSCVFNISRNTSFNRSSITHFCVAFLYIVSTLSFALKKELCTLRFQFILVLTSSILLIPQHSMCVRVRISRVSFHDIVDGSHFENYNQIIIVLYLVLSVCSVSCI